MIVMFPGHQKTAWGETASISGFRKQICSIYWANPHTVAGDNNPFRVSSRISLYDGIRTWCSLHKRSCACGIKPLLLVTAEGRFYLLTAMKTLNTVYFVTLSRVLVLIFLKPKVYFM